VPQNLGAGTPILVSATAFTTITTAAARLIGVLFHGTGTALIDGIYNCKSTASATATTQLGGRIVANTTIAIATVNNAVFVEFPAMFTDGIVVDIGASADPAVTLFIVAG
jgi:hypothetical protein